MWKYLSTLVFIILVVLVISFVRSNARSMRSPLHTDLQLAANFGELRPDHFHMGLDIRTNGKENWSVYAIEKGYISRIKIEPGGYGRSVFITHDNGYTSVYAHLNRYYDVLEEYVHQVQYKTNSWQQDLTFSPGRFPVLKDGLVAFSGNTGQSEGPHLHFEMRETRTGEHVNPAMLGFVAEDNTPPVIQGLYWYDRRYSTYEAGPSAIAIFGEKGNYRTIRKMVKTTSPLVSFGIRADDRVDDSRFRYGIYRTRVWVDEVLVHDVMLNKILSSDTKYVNGYIDYSWRITKGQYIQHLSRLPGNQLPVFGNRDGLIKLTDHLPHKVEVRVSDVAGNESALKFDLQLGNVDAVSHKYLKGTRVLQPGVINTVISGHAEIRFNRLSFYDAVPFVVKDKISLGNNAVSARITLHNATVPVHEKYIVRVKASLKLTDRLRNKTVMQFSGFKKRSTVKGSWVGNFMEAAFDQLGTVQLFVDTLAPEINTVGWKNSEKMVTGSKSLSITVADNMDDINGFRAELDGRWILFMQKGNLFTYQFDEYCPPGKHRLSIRATDVAGNIGEKEFSFQRQ